MGSERVTCECEQCEVVTRHEAARFVMGTELPACDVKMWVWMADTPDEKVLDYYTDGEGCVYCPACPTQLSFDVEGTPVTKAMVPKAALKRLAAWAAKYWGGRLLNTGDCPFPDPDRDCPFAVRCQRTEDGSNMSDAEWAECLMAYALAAAEEARDE